VDSKQSRLVNTWRLARAAPWGRLREPQSHVRELSGLVLGGTLESPYNLARQLRPYLPWSVPARRLAWLWRWRLRGWWRALSLQKEMARPRWREC
jgi:hypothetical protein